MKITSKKLFASTALALAVSTAFVTTAAQASAATSSYVNVTYTINSISNLSNAGDLSGLNMLGSFDLATVANNPYQAITGTGSITPTLTGTGSTAVTGRYSRTLQLDTTAADWSQISANYLAWFSLAFTNTSATDSYAVNMTLSYDLFASASGNSAFSDVSVNYYNGDSSISNIAAPDYVQALAGANLPNALSNSHVFDFTLAAGSAETVYVDAAISATAAPVPLPAAVWSFLAGLMGILGLKKRNKQRPAESV
jgi:hypothetical protein